MNILFKKRATLFTLFFLFSLNLIAQQSRFIYIQTENKQLFYIRMDKKILSSSASGHIIISKLTDSIYKFSIGFPKNEWPEQNVTISVKDADAGFILKNLGERGWGLLNLQTRQVLAVEVKENAKRNIEIDITRDEFAKVLASVVNDPSIAQIKRILNETTPVNEIAENKTEVQKANTEVVKPVKSGKKRSKAKTKKDEISKLMYDSTAQGINITYLDMLNKDADTVKVSIPVNKSADRKETDSYKDSTAKKLNVKGLIVNSHCKKTATHNDFLKLQKQMAAEINENNRIKAANKQFITICFTTEQIKNLGILFTKEEEKYKFYVGAFPFVSDAHNYASLQDQLTDSYYISRFKAMISH